MLVILHKLHILVIGCSAHIVHNSVHTSCYSLPLAIEVIVITIYKYFHIYTVRLTKLEQFCELVETDYRKYYSMAAQGSLVCCP
jgi:hypothetical protein